MTLRTIDRNLAMHESPGIDFAQGLAMTGQDAVIYRRLLQAFFATHRQDVSALRRALALEDLDAARDIAHALKGVVGMLGAGALQVTAERAMHACDLGAPASDRARLALEALATELAPVLAAVGAVIADSDSNADAAAEPIDPDAVMADFERLLLDCDPAAADLLGVLSRGLDRGLYGAELMLLEQRVSAANFDAARDALNDLRRIRQRYMQRSQR